MSIYSLFNLVFVFYSTALPFFFYAHLVNDETDSESVKLRMPEPNNEKPPPQPIQLKIRKNWRETLCRRIYIFTWIRNYDQNTAVSDMIAGVTLGQCLISNLSLIIIVIVVGIHVTRASKRILFIILIVVLLFVSIDLKIAFIWKWSSTRTTTAPTTKWIKHTFIQRLYLQLTQN